MDSVVQAITLSAAGTAMLSWVAFLIVRAVISARFLSEAEFEEFQENGITNSFSLLPAKGLVWESRFINEKLPGSGDPSAARYALVWKTLLRIFCVSGILLCVGSVVLAVI